MFPARTILISAALLHRGTVPGCAIAHRPAAISEPAIRWSAVPHRPVAIHGAATPHRSAALAGTTIAAARWPVESVGTAGPVLPLGPVRAEPSAGSLAETRRAGLGRSVARRSLARKRSRRERAISPAAGFAAAVFATKRTALAAACEGAPLRTLSRKRTSLGAIACER